MGLPNAVKCTSGDSSCSCISKNQYSVKQSQTLVEVWCGGDDNLTQGVCRAVDSEFASTPNFVVSSEERPGTLIVLFQPMLIGKRAREKD